MDQAENIAVEQGEQTEQGEQVRRNDRARDLQLVVRIPFCPRKCRHCSRNVACHAPAEKLAAYARAVAREMEALAPDVENRTVTSVHIVGGILTLLPEGELSGIMAAARSCFRISSNAEVLLETEPGFLKPNRLAEYVGCGVNRINLHALTANCLEHKELNPPYDIADFKQTAWLLRQREFRNFSIEVPLGIPHQTEKTLLDTLFESQCVGPVEMKVTPFVLRESAALADAAKAGTPLSMANAQTRAKMWEAGAKLLGRYNYRPASTTSFAFSGHESEVEAHRLAAGDVLGVGAGALSWYDGFTYRNTDDVGLYIERPDGAEVICQQAAAVDSGGAMRRFAACRLRSRGGLDPVEFHERFGSYPAEVFGPEIDGLLAAGLLERSQAAEGDAEGNDEGIAEGNADYALPLKMTPLGIADPAAIEPVFGAW